MAGNLWVLPATATGRYHWWPIDSSRPHRAAASHWRPSHNNACSECAAIEPIGAVLRCRLPVTHLLSSPPLLKVLSRPCVPPQSRNSPASGRALHREDFGAQDPGGRGAASPARRWGGRGSPEAEAGGPHPLCPRRQRGPRPPTPQPGSRRSALDCSCLPGAGAARLAARPGELSRAQRRILRNNNRAGSAGPARPPRPPPHHVRLCAVPGGQRLLRAARLLRAGLQPHVPARLRQPEGLHGVPQPRGGGGGGRREPRRVGGAPAAPQGPDPGAGRWARAGPAEGGGGRRTEPWGGGGGRAGGIRKWPPGLRRGKCRGDRGAGRGAGPGWGEPPPREKKKREGFPARRIYSAWSHFCTSAARVATLVRVAGFCPLS